MYRIHEIGKDAEEKAAEWFLSRKKARLLARNYRCKWGEIDLIFEEDVRSNSVLEIVFIEVKARAMRSLVDGPHSVGWKKQKRLGRTATHFLEKYKGTARSVRFDLLYWNGEIWGYLPNIWFDSQL